MERYTGPVALVVMGVVFLISQILILRTFLLVFQGNEFSIGIVLGNWFLLEALGSWVFGKRAARARNPRSSFVRIQLALSLLLPVTLLAVLVSPTLPGVSPWEALSLVRTAALSFLLLLPLAVFNGAAFVYGCRLLAGAAGEDARIPGRVYVLESAGACAGGVFFTFLLVGRLSAMETAFGLGALNLFCSLLLLFPGRARGLRWLCSGILIGFIAGLVSGAAGTMHRWSMQLRWAPLSLERTSDSVYGNITVLRVGDERVLYQNGIPAITLTTPDRKALEEKVHIPLLAHSAPGEILFLGGGAGGALQEALKHPLRRVCYTEIDPLLIQTVEEVSPSRWRAEREDPRTDVVLEDGRFFLRNTERRFDVILIHFPDASNLQLNRFFTAEFFRLVRDRLRPGGVLSFTLPGSDTYLSEERILVNRCVLETLQEVFRHVRILPGDRNLFLVSDDPALAALDHGRMVKRLRRRGVSTSVVQDAYLQYKMDPSREQWLREELEAVSSVRRNRDLSPALLTYVLAHENAEVQPAMRGAVLVLEKIDAGVLLWVLVLVNLPLILAAAAGKRRRFRALGYSIFTTGFSGMAVEMIAILTFQSIYGYLYHWIGILLATFMAGLAAGAWWMTGRLERLRNGFRTFCLLEAALAALLVLIAWGLPLAHACFLEAGGGSHAFKLFLPVMNLLAGVLVGSEFPLANRESAGAGQGDMTVVAGRFYALDLAGAWAGTFLASVLLIPLLGFRDTLLLAALLKGLALAGLALAAFRGGRFRLWPGRAGDV